ncbi:MAG: hypothetical protein FJZ16_01035 [Candidatus Omnitrophica bacterium]|nr:hypothetical protein [Candidatus Omnitrophota bacterium]
MREILFRNLISQDKKHADISVKEVFEDKGFVTTAEKRCIYVIKKQEVSNLPYDSAGFLGEEISRKNCSKRQFFITKFHDVKNNDDYLILRVLGDFYVVFANQLFLVTFKYIMKIRQEKKQQVNV